MCRLSWPASFTASCLFGISEPQLSWPGFRMRLCPSEHSWRRSRRDPSPACPARRSSSRRTERDVPPVMVWHVKHNRALHENLFVLTVSTGSAPWVKDTERLTFGEIAPRFWRAAARYGFMERPDIPALLRQAHERGCAIDLSDITYYVGHETVVPGEDEKALPRLVEALFAFMQRNSAHLTEYFKLPVEAVVEIGREVSI